MATILNGKPIRERGGRKHTKDWSRSVRAAAQAIQDTGSTAGVVANGKKDYTPAMNIHFDGAETYEDHLIPRQSLSERQALALFPVKVEKMTLRTRQLDHSQIIMPGENPLDYMIETTDDKIVWRSDRTLLNRSKVDQFDTMIKGIKRFTSQSKRIEYGKEVPQMNPDADINVSGVSDVVEGERDAPPDTITED